jgi:hypothetical protein
MLQQIVRRLRSTVSLQVTRRRAADEPCPADASRHERPLPRCSDTDGEIEPLVDEVDRAIGEIEVECKLRMRGRECGDRRPEMELAKRHSTGQRSVPRGTTVAERTDASASSRSASSWTQRS